LAEGNSSSSHEAGHGGAASATISAGRAWRRTTLPVPVALWCIGREHRAQQMGLFHITTRAAWQRARATGSYQPASLAAEGFIHLSTDKQWLAVANARYRGQHELVLLSVRDDRLDSELRFEEADGQRYPHLYGPLPVESVVDAFDLPVAEDGTIGVPEGLAPWRALFEP